MTESTESSRYDTPEQVRKNFQQWWQAMEASHEMLMAGLRDRVGPDGDVQTAYKEWNEARLERKRKAYERAGARYKQRIVEENSHRDDGPCHPTQ